MMTLFESKKASAIGFAERRERMVLDAAYIQSCGYHTVDISPCADGRLQGLLPFVFRMAPNAAVFVKAYAGVLFDVEGAFIFSWAVSLRELGWQGWLEILFFIVMQMLGLAYVWRKGGLEWGPMRKRV